MTVKDYLYYETYVNNLDEFRNKNIKVFGFAKLVKLDKEIVKWRNKLKQATEIN